MSHLLHKVKDAVTGHHHDSKGMRSTFCENPYQPLLTNDFLFRASTNTYGSQTGQGTYGSETTNYGKLNPGNYRSGAGESGSHPAAGNYGSGAGEYGPHPNVRNYETNAGGYGSHHGTGHYGAGTGDFGSQAGTGSYGGYGSGPGRYSLGTNSYGSPGGAPGGSSYNTPGSGIGRHSEGAYGHEPSKLGSPTLESENRYPAGGAQRSQCASVLLLIPTSTPGQKSRRKKAAVTIENIAPGRAPLGACRPISSATSPFHHVDNRAVTPSSSEWPRPASKCDSQHVSQYLAILRDLCAPSNSQ
ncbi:unnamed protein product [Aspergillus oryzae]|nr:unnamed protein product [Aspergillus oryzae]